MPPVPLSDLQSVYTPNDPPRTVSGETQGETFHGAGGGGGGGSSYVPTYYILGF